MPNGLADGCTTMAKNPASVFRFKLPDLGENQRVEDPSSLREKGIP
ncbi:MAG: hypothetical protein AABN95_05635 [Acidobacteriota bacterium]